MHVFAYHYSNGHWEGRGHFMCKGIYDEPKASTLMTNYRVFIITNPLFTPLIIATSMTSFNYQ